MHTNIRSIALILATSLSACGGQETTRVEDMEPAADDSVPATEAAAPDPTEDPGQAESSTKAEPSNALAPEEPADSADSTESSTLARSSTSSALVTGSVTFGVTFKTTAALNLRKGPATSYAVRVVMPNGATALGVKSASVNGWYELNYLGRVGWASGKYLQIVASPSGAVAAAMARAKSARGFSYHWGYGDWDPTSQSPGACYGSCPSCTHSGSWGADCSGFAAKVWVVPSSNTPLTKVYHPYNTASFKAGSSYWKSIARSNMKPADAFVYHSGGSGHIFIYADRDGWSSVKTYECMGCSKGCNYNVRNGVSSSYVAIRRNGYY